MEWAEVKGSVRRSLARFVGRWHYEIVRHPCPADLIAATGADLVIDVGANEGQYGRELRSRGYAGPILSLEPVADAFETLARTAARDELWEVRKSAAGERAGRATINVAEGTDMSSFHPHNAAGMVLDPRIAVDRQEDVEVVRLDDLPGLASARRPYLKIDTQGHERQVLEGARDILVRAVGVELELPLINIYDGVWHFYDAMEFMRARGFVPAQIRPITFSDEVPASLVEVDCVFRRCGPPRDHAPLLDNTTMDPES